MPHKGTSGNVGFHDPVAHTVWNGVSVRCMIGIAPNTHAQFSKAFRLRQIGVERGRHDLMAMLPQFKAQCPDFGSECLDAALHAMGANEACGRQGLRHFVGLSGADDVPLENHASIFKERGRVYLGQAPFAFTRQFALKQSYAGKFRKNFHGMHECGITGLFS